MFLYIWYTYVYVYARDVCHKILFVAVRQRMAAEIITLYRKEPASSGLSSIFVVLQSFP